MTTNTDLWRQTPGEFFWLWRRVNNITQVQAAALFSVCPVTYWRYETDQLEKCGEFPMYASVHPNVGDYCALARRRSGMGLRETAAAAAVSRQTVLNWEDRGDEKMVQFWRDKGYRFPR